MAAGGAAASDDPAATAKGDKDSIAKLKARIKWLGARVTEADAEGYTTCSQIFTEGDMAKAALGRK